MVGSYFHTVIDINVSGSFGEALSHRGSNPQQSELARDRDYRPPANFATRPHEPHEISKFLSTHLVNLSWAIAIWCPKGDKTSGINALRPEENTDSFSRMLVRRCGQFVNSRLNANARSLPAMGPRYTPCDDNVEDWTFVIDDMFDHLERSSCRYFSEPPAPLGAAQSFNPMTPRAVPSTFGTPVQFQIGDYIRLLQTHT